MKQLLIVFVFSLVLVNTASATPLQKKKNITRTEDPVIVSGKDLKSFIGIHPDKISLMTYFSGKFSPIPFQIDQRQANGMYAFTFGKEASIDEDPNLDENDELVFMLSDLGERPPTEKLPEGATIGMELEVVDPLDQGKGWVYLFKYLKDPPYSEMDYVKLELDTKKGRKKIIGRNQGGKGVIIGAPLDSVSVDELRFISPDGKITPDFLDRMKIRGDIRLKALPYTFQFKVDQMIREELNAWIDGPIRIIYQGRGYFKFGIINQIGQGHEEITMYRNSMFMKTTFTMPFNINKFLKKFIIRGYIDFNKNGHGIKLYSQAIPSSANIVLDGKTNNDEGALTYDTHCGWIAGQGAIGGIVFRMFPPTGGDWDETAFRLFLNEDLEKKYNPEDEQGELAVGITMSGIEKVNLREGKTMAACYFVNNFDDRMEKPLINILDHPVEVICRPISESLISSNFNKL